MPNIVTDDPVEIFLIPIYGLANRMRALASGFVLSDYFDWPISIIWEKDGNCNCAYSKLFEGSVKLVPEEKHKQLMDRISINKNMFQTAELAIPDKIPDNQLVIECGTTFIPPGMPSEDYNQKYLEKLSDLFSPSSEVLDRLEIPPSNYIGVHIRRTDNIASSWASTDGAFCRIIGEILDKDNEEQFYVASDSIESKKLIKDKFGDNIHIHSNPIISRNSEEGMVDAFAEMWTLSQSTRILGSYGSSYGKLASDLGQCNIFYVTEVGIGHYSDYRDKIGDLCNSSHERINKGDTSVIDELSTVFESNPFDHRIRWALARAFHEDKQYSSAFQHLSWLNENLPVPSSEMSRLLAESKKNIQQ